MKTRGVAVSARAASSHAIGLIDAPGRITGGEIRLAGRRIDGLAPEAMRRVRGRQIGAVFPRMAFDRRKTCSASA